MDHGGGLSVSVYTDDQKFEFESIRKECANEHTLISHRVGWLIAFEAFLFSTYGLALTRDLHTTFWWFPLIVVPVLGTAGAFFAMGPINAAVVTLELWHTKEKDFLMKHSHFDSLSRRNRPDQAHHESMKLPKYIPRIFVGVWLLAGGAALVEAWSAGIIPLK